MRLWLGVSGICRRQGRDRAGWGTEFPGEPSSVGRRVTSCFSPSGLPEQIPGHQVLLGGGPARPPGLALDRRGPATTPAVSDHGPGWVAPPSSVYQNDITAGTKGESEAFPSADTSPTVDGSSFRSHFSPLLRHQPGVPLGRHSSPTAPLRAWFPFVPVTPSLVGPPELHPVREIRGRCTDGGGWFSQAVGHPHDSDPRALRTLSWLRAVVRQDARQHGRQSPSSPSSHPPQTPGGR